MGALLRSIWRARVGAVLCLVPAASVSSIALHEAFGAVDWVLSSFNANAFVLKNLSLSLPLPRRYSELSGLAKCVDAESNDRANNKTRGQRPELLDDTSVVVRPGDDGDGEQQSESYGEWSSHVESVGVAPECDASESVEDEDADDDVVESRVLEVCLVEEVHGCCSCVWGTML